MARVCGLTRCSLTKQVDSPAVQISQILEGAQRLGLPTPEILSEPPGTSGVSTVFRKRPEGRKLWHNLRKGDTLIVAKLDRLGRNCRDIRSTLDHFQDNEVRVVILDLFGGQGMDLNGPIGQIIVTIMSAVAQMEAEAISERTKQHAQWAKELGLCYGNTVWGKKKVPIPDGGTTSRGNPKCRMEWDHDFLKLMAEFVDRLRNGENKTDLLYEFRENHIDFRGKPFMEVYKASGGAWSPSSMRAKVYATDWCKRFIRNLHNGRLPAQFCMQGVINKVDAGISKDLKWIDKPDFTNKRGKYKRKAIKEDRSEWSSNDWKQWWDGSRDASDDAEDVDSLLSTIKKQAAQHGLVTSQEASS